MTIHRERTVMGGFRLDIVDFASDRYFSGAFEGFLTLQGTHEVGASGLQAGCKVRHLALRGRRRRVRFGVRGTQRLHID